MGNNSRYGGRLGNHLDRGIEEWLTRPQPISLSDQELDKEHSQPHVPEVPVRVRAWVRFPEQPIHTACSAVAWTDRAVLVEWKDARGRPYSCWVWASAVERVAPAE